MRRIRLILSVLFDELGLLVLQISDLLIDFHLLLVKGGLVLDALVQEQTELISLVNAIDQNGDQGHFLLVTKLCSEVYRFYPSEFCRYFGDVTIERSKHVWILTSGIHQNEADDLRPEFLLFLNDLIKSSQDLVLLLAGGRDSACVGLQLVLGEQVLQVVVSEGRHEMVDHVETFLPDMLQLHLLRPVKLFLDLSDTHGHSRVTFGIVAEARSQLFQLELRRLEELVEVVAKLPDVKDALELLRSHINLHRRGFSTHDATMQLRHLLDEAVWDGVPHRVALNVLGVQLAEYLELRLDQSVALDLLSLHRGQNVLSFHSLALLRFESRLSQG